MYSVAEITRTADGFVSMRDRPFLLREEIWAEGYFRKSSFASPRFKTAEFHAEWHKAQIDSDDHEEHGQDEEGETVSATLEGKPKRRHFEVEHLNFYYATEMMDSIEPNELEFYSEQDMHDYYNMLDGCAFQ